MLNPTTTKTKTTKTNNFGAAGNLAKLLYFQQHPGAPIKPTKSKSMAAAYLTPSILGTLLGIALDSSSSSSSQSRQRQILRDRHGIKSNHIYETEWTGVSLTRWESIIENLAVCNSEIVGGSAATTTTVLLSHAIWSMMVWEISYDKSCLLEAILSLEEVSNIQILDTSSDSNNELAKAIRYDISAQKEWETTTFDDNTQLLSNDSIESSIEYILKNYHHSTTIQQQSLSSSSSIEMGRAIEIVCAALSMSTKTKPVCPHGHYGYDGGETKPDCVEVAVRELMNLLLWDDQRGCFDLTRLPSTASPKLYQLYNNQQPTTTLLDKHQSNNNKQNIKDDGNHQETDNGGGGGGGGGKEWFDALSNLPGCDYLSTSPNGIPYELSPTMRNMAKIFHYLLKGYNTTITSDEKQQNQWTSLKDIQRFWKPHNLQLKEDILRHKAGMSDDYHVHEIATIALERGARHAIDMRLRLDAARNTGFATVSHLRVSTKRLSSDAIEQLILLDCDGHLDFHHENQDESTMGMNSQCLDLLVLASAGDDFLMMQQKKEHKNSDKDMIATTSLDVRSLFLQILSAPYGLDRRELMPLAATSDLEREEKAIKKALRESEDVLKQAVIKTCQFLQRRNSPEQQQQLDDGVQQLLIWILSEIPDVDLNPATALSSRYDEKVEQAILKLPMSILVEKDVQSNLRSNPFIRGDLLVQLINWKAGNSSLFRIMTTQPRALVPILWHASRWEES